MNHPDKSQDDFDKSSMSDLYKVYPQTLPTNTISQQKLIPASLLNAYPWNSDNQGNYFSMCGSPVFPYLPNPLDSFGRMVSSVSTASNMLNYFLLQNAYSPQMTNFQPLSSAPPSQCYPAMSTPEESKGINMFPTQTASPTPPASFNSSSIYPYIMHPCLSQLDLSSTNYAASQGVDLRAKTSSGIVSNASVLDSRDAPLKKLNSTMSTDFSSSMNKSAFKTNREVPMGSNDLVGNFHPGDFSMCCSDSLSGNFEKSCKNECQDVCETTFKKKNSALLSNALNLTTDNVTKESSYEKVLYRNIISEMNMDILFDNELEEWLTKVTVKSLLYDTCSLLHQYSTSVYLDQTSSPRSNFNTYKYKFKKTSAELALIKYTVSSQWCAVCQEVARPMELALLGDLLVYCKDCGLAVHRRCYGVHRIFVDDQQDKHFLFLCCFCQNVRRLNKKKALKVRHSGKKEIGCAICSRHYDGTTEPEAFHPISNHDNIWVHTYCAFLSRNHVQIKDIQFVRTLEWIGPVEPYSVTKQDTQNILQKNYFTSLEKLQDFNTLSKKDTGFESHLQTKCEDPLNGENVTSEPSTVVHCMFCFKTSGVLLQCSTVNCSNFMHLYCLKRQIQCTEQDGKSSITTALTVTLGNPFTFTTSFILNISCLLHLVTPSYCLCRKPFTPSEQSMMVGCDVCGDWLHGSCIGSNEVTRAIQKEYYKCLRCENQSFYFQFLDLLWSTFPLEHADYAICRQFLNHLFLLESNSVHSSIISPFFKIIPSHTDPLPFTDILLLCFAWQWRIQALLLVDRVTLLPATTTSVPEKNNMVKKISLNKRIKLAGHRQEGKLSETNSCPVEYPIPSLKKKEMPLLVSFKTKNVNKGLHVQEKIKRKSEFKGTHTFPHYTGSTEKVKKNHKTNRMDMDGKKESKLLKSDSPCLKNSSVSNNDQEVLVENDLMDATWSGTSKDMCFFKSNVPLTPICSIRDLLRIQSLAQCLPIGVVFWVESLNDCIQRCQSWIDDVKECLKGSDVDQLDKLVNYFNAKTITAFLASTKGNISKVSEYSLPMPRTCYLNMISPYWAVNLKIKENIPSFIVGGLVLVTQEASHVRETAVIELFLKKYHSCVFETPTKGLDATIIKFIRAEILRVPELESLQKHPMFTTCQTLLNRIQECKTKAYQLKQNTRASLKEIQELLETVENEVPQNHQIDLYNFPEVVSKAKELEEQVDWSNLRSIRETLNQAQQLPVTSDVFDKLQILIQEVDSWRKEYHRFISLVKATPNHMLPTSEAEEKDETHNVVLSGRSGFLKNLFVSSTDPTKMIMDKYHETRHDADGSTPLYTQSQTFESALKLMEKKNKINVQCDEVTLLQEWISQCQKWIDDANCVLGALHNTPLNEGVQNSSIHDMPPGHFQKDHQKMSQGASWQLPQMETLLRRKAELPLAVPLHFADLLRERVHELQCIESKANKVALGNFSEGKEHEQFHTRNEAQQLATDIERLIEGISSCDSEQQRVLQLEKSFMILNKNLSVLNAWESVVKLSSQLTDLLLWDSHDTEFQTILLLSSQIDPILKSSSFSYPPKLENLFYHYAPIVDIQNICTNSFYQNIFGHDWKEFYTNKNSLVHFQTREMVISVDNANPSKEKSPKECSQDCMDAELFDYEKTDTCISKTGINIILKYWDNVWEQIKSCTTLTLNLRQSLVQWASLLLIHFVLLQHPHESRVNKTLQCFVNSVPWLLFSLNVGFGDFIPCFIPSSDITPMHNFLFNKQNISIQKNDSLDQLISDDERDTQNISSTTRLANFSCNYFLLKLEKDFFNDSIGRLFCFQFIVNSSLLQFPSQRTMEDWLKFVRQNPLLPDCSTGKQTSWSSFSLFHGQDNSSHKAWINLEKDAIASPMHIHVLDTLGAFVTQMSLKQKSCLEWDILLRVQQITWPLRASFVLRALNTVNQTQSFLTDVTLEHVTVLLQEYKMHNLYSHNDMYEPLKQYLQQLDAWISETIQQLTQPCVTYSVLPQIMLTNKYLYQNYSTLFLVLGISSPTGSDAIHYSNLLLKREQWNTPVYHDAVSKFLCSEQIFRQRWLYESLNGSCTKDTTAETFTQDIQKLHQDLLCIDTCAQFEPKTGYCNINTSSVHQEDLASNSLVSTHNLLDLLHQCQTDYDLFYTGDFAEKENLSTLQAPFSYSSAQSFQYAFNNSDVCHAYWCTVSQGSTSLPVHNCCYTSHLCLMRQLDAVLHQGFSIAPCVSYPMYESHVTCFDSVQPISETRQVDKISSHEKIRIDLHRFSRETYKVAQESVLSMYVTYASVQYTNIDNLLSERPVLCYQNNVYLQLLELRRDITRWAISTSFILLKSVGSSNWTLKNHEFCIVEDNLRRCSTLEAFISLENSLMKLQARSKNVMQQLFNTGAEHSEMIFYAFGVQHFNSSDFDVSNVGGSFHHELITRIHTVQAQITALEENLKTKRHIHFLKTVHFWDQFVSPYLDVRVPCEPATPSGSFFTLEKPDFVESQKSQQVAFDLMSLCTSVRKIQTILFEKTRLYSYLEEFCLLFLTLLLVWCVHREEVSSETTLAIKKQVLARLPPLLVQVIENLNVHELRILPFLHISSDFGIVAIALKDGLNPEIHNVVFLHSEIFLWIALSVDVFSLNHTILSDIIPHHSTLYEDILKSIKTLTKYDLQENEPFLSQALHCFTTPHTLHDVPEALGLPIDFIKWRLMVRLHMIPCTVSYFFLNDTLKKEKVLGEGLKRQMVYRVVYSDATRNLSNRVSAKDYEKTFYRFFPVSRSLAVKEEFYDNAYMSVSWNLHQPVLLLTNAPQITPYDFFLKNGVETLQLKLRHQATTLALNKIQWNFDALQKSLPASSFNNEDVKSNQYCTLTLPGTSQSLFQTFMDNCVHHFLVENVFMYLEDVFQWQQHTENIVELLKYRKKEKELMFSRLNSAPNDAPCPFNKWNLCDLKEYKKLLLKLWDVHNLYDDPPYEKSIHATSCFGTLQQLCSLYNKGVILHCHAPNGSVSDYLSRELSFFIKTVTDLEFQGDGLLQKCESLETDWNKNKISCTHSQEKHRIENDNFIQRNLFEYLSIQEIELFLKNSSFIHLKSHSKLKKLFRLYLELEYFATVAFSQQTLPLRMFVPNPIESSFSLFLHSSNEHIMSDNSHLTGENETNTCSTSQLVFFVYSRAMSSSLPVNSEFRIKILQQCWIIAARCAIKGFYGYSTETKKCVCLNDYGIPMKTLQLMCLASRSLFSEETLPPESQLFKILLGAAKRFLFEARTTLDTWIRLRIMVQYYPVLVLDEMQLIQEKLKTKFPNLSIEIVKEKNKIIQVQVYKDKNIKTRYFPSEPLDIKEFSTYPVTINRWQVVSSILHEAAMYSDQDILVHCYNVSLEGPLLTELLETKIRDATRDCLCKLFPKGSVSDAFDREQLLYNTAGSTLNEHYFIALQEMMLKRLQQSVISRRVLPQVSSLNASLSTDTETFSMNSYATNTKTQNKSTIKTQEADQLHKTIDALLLSKPKVSTVEYKKQLEHNLSCSLQVSTSSLDPAIPSKFQFPSDLQLTVSERSGFLWTGFLKIEPKESEAILKKLFSLPSVLEEKESEFQIWVVPLFAPVAKPLLLFLRTKSHFYLKKTLGIEEFSNYANPIASNNHHATVMLLNVIIGADWSMGEEMENEMTISTEVILQKCLRPSTLTVTCDVPKCRIPSEQMELLEQDALKKSLQVLCFSTSEEDLEMHQTETVRLWIIPPEPIVVESFMSTDFPKSSQLLFGTLEIPITLLGEACCVNGSLSDVREYAASVVLSLKDQKVKDALQKKLPKFHNLRITLPRTTFHWITKPKQVMTCPVLTCDTPENEIEEKCTQNLQNSTNNANQSDTSGLFRIPKRLKQGENLPGVSTTCMDNTSKTFEEVSEISSVTLPVQKVKYHFKSHHKPCFSKRDAQKRHSPVTHHHMEHRRPSQRLFRNVVQKFAIQGDKPSLQWKRQPLVSNPVPRLFQPSHVQSIRHPPKPVVPKLYPSQIGAIDPYAPPRPSIAPQPESHRPILSPDLDSGLSPPINACMTPNRKTTPPWKQQKVNSTNCLPFKVPPALKTLIRGAAAELRLNQPTHLPPFQ